MDFSQILAIVMLSFAAVFLLLYCVPCLRPRRWRDWR